MLHIIVVYPANCPLRVDMIGSCSVSVHNTKMLLTIVGISFLISAATAGVTEREKILCHTGVRFDRKADK